MKLMRIGATAAIAGALLFSLACGQTLWTISSPGDKVKATVQLADLGGTADYPTGKVRLYYSVSVGGPSAYAEVVQTSPMGLVRSDRNFIDSLTFVSVSQQRTIDSSYTMIMGKRSLCRNYCNEKVLTFKTSTGGSLLQLYLRAYDDGFAFRYVFPDTSATLLTVTSEASGFRIPAGSVGWMVPYNTSPSHIPKGDDYAPAYEDSWQRNVPVGSGITSPGVGGVTTTPRKPSDSTWCMPMLFKTTGGNWVLLWETDVTPNYCNSRLSAASQLVYRIKFPNADEAKNIGAATPSYRLPWTMPWRVVIAGTNPGTILESTLSTDLATPCVLNDVSWIKPGRASWSWWSANTSPSNYSLVTPFIDLASQMTWEYSVIDEEWPSMTGGTWQQAVTYAAQKNVGIWLWYNAGGANNSLVDRPRDKLYDSTTRNSEFQTISTAGVKGAKVDFWMSDKQNIVKYYWDVFRDAAKYHILVNIHGGTIPRGWQRTYPNCITAEAVRGQEMYIWDAYDPQLFPWEQTIMPFARNAVASMDWTPVTFSNNIKAHLTTYGHELALSVVFESGVQHFADKVAGYNTPMITTGVQTFLKQVPVTWDDTKYVLGYPGSWVVLARRKGTDWYASGIVGDTAKNMTVKLSFLQNAPASYKMTLITDGTSATTFSESVDTVTSGDSIKINTPVRGGWVAKFVNLGSAGVKNSAVAMANNQLASHYSIASGESYVLPGVCSGKNTEISVYAIDGRLLKNVVVGTRIVNFKRDFALSPGTYILRLDIR